MSKILSLALILCLAMSGLAGLAFTVPNAKAADIINEQFSTDVFTAGDWFRSDSTVHVNATDGWLLIGAGGGYDSYAERSMSASLPIVVEARMKLIDDGRNYRLPGLKIYTDSGSNESVYITYLSNATSQWGGWAFGLESSPWTFSEVLAPEAENVWRTVRATIRKDGGELAAKDDGDSSFTQIASGNWTISGSAVKIRLSQPWDSECAVDYVKVSEEGRGSTPGFGFASVLIATAIASLIVTAHKRRGW